MSRAISLLGLRWTSASHHVKISSIVQYIVVTGGIGGINTDAKYIDLKVGSVKGRFSPSTANSASTNKDGKITPR